MTGRDRNMKIEKNSVCEIERNNIDGQTERETDRQTDRQTDSETER